MKISRKMILIFSAMIFAITAINAYYLVSTNVEGSDAFTENRYKNMAKNMVRNIDQYISSMDLAIEDLINDNDFIEAFYQISTKGDDDISSARTWQNTLSNTLFHSPIIDSFYRISIFSESGFYLSNHIDRNDSLVNFSDETREVIASIPYLEVVGSSPYRRVLLGPHPDEFTPSRPIDVFSAVRSVSLHGEHIGYIEVSANVSELEEIFSGDSESIMVRAVLKDGHVLYSSSDDQAVYEDIPINAMTDYTDPDGIERQVYHSQSQWLGIDIYISQDSEVHYRYMTNLIGSYVLNSLIIAAAAIILIVIVSMGLTSSTRKLTEKMRSLPIDQIVLNENVVLTDTFVSKSGDKEIYEMEETFNLLMHRLQNSAQREMELREGTLNARLKALQAQINPHFVYNMLNIIAAKAMEIGSEDIVEMSDHFAQMLRYATDNRSDYVTLKEDLTNAAYFLELLKARYEDGLEFTIDVPCEMDNIMMPRLSLQPLVENSIIHGFDNGIGVRIININGSMNDQEAVLEIRDNGSGFAPDVLSELQESIRRINLTSEAPAANGHIGLLNTCWRLSVYSKGTLTMEVMNDNGAVVKLRMKLE